MLDTAERGERTPPRFVARNPAFHPEAIRFHVEVESERLIRARLGAATTEQEAQARA
jgi:hypothetical protein